MKYWGLLLGLFCFSTAIAQYHDNNWLLSQQYGAFSTKVEFLPSLSIDTVARNLRMNRTTVTMSDSVGNLLFYTNGIKIYNGQYQLMDNGDSLNPGQLANNSTFGYPYAEIITSIPHPTQPNKYYVLHQAVTSSSSMAGFSDKLYYTLIDMSANGGLGRVENKNQILLENDSICGSHLEVVKHGNGRDWWLIQPMGYSNGYHIFLISGNSITYSHKQYLGNSHFYASEFLGQAVFSHQGTKYIRYDNLNDLDIYDFDRCTGYLSNYLHISITDSVDNVPNSAFYTGAAISLNDRFLYLSSYIYVYQFDLLASNIAQSKDTVAVYDGYVHNGFAPTFFSTIQSAPNGKIYSVVIGSPYLHVIDNPNIGGLGCNVIQRGLSLLFGNNHMPNFPHYRTPPLAGSACDTITSIAEPDKAEGENKVSLYPNPSSTYVHIESAELLQKVVVYDALGRELLRVDAIEQSVLELDTRALESGVYFMSVFVGGEVVNKQFIVQKE